MSTDEQWKRFFAGHWQTELPQTAGLYFIATRQGEQGFTRAVYQNPLTKAYAAVTAWGGWWWSEPIPALPSTPYFPLNA